MKMSEQMAAAAAGWAKAEWFAEQITAATAADWPFEHTAPTQFVVVPGGKKYAKIAATSPSGKPEYVHAFVEVATGHVFKAEGWSKPAKGIRFYSVEEAALAFAAQPGHKGSGYLYA